MEEEEEDQFSLADQIRATPERSLKKEKKKKNRRSTDSEALSADSGKAEDDEIPPPLPPALPPGLCPLSHLHLNCFANSAAASAAVAITCCQTLPPSFESAAAFSLNQH